MARYSVSEARRTLSRLLDAAERGEEVILERRGTRFRLMVDESRSDVPASSPLIVRDPALLDGEWHWQFENGQLQL